MSQQNIPDHLKHLVGEISEKDLRRLAEMEPSASAGAAEYRSTAHTRMVNDPRPASAAAQQPGYDYTPWKDNIEIDPIQPDKDNEAAVDDDGLKLPSAEDLVVAGTVGVFTVGMILESYYRHFRRLKRAYQRQSALVRGLESIALAMLILMVIGYGVAREAKAYIDSRRGPFLEDALVAPYSLEEQSVSNASQSETLIPAVIGDYQRIDQPITRSYTSSPTNQCLLGLGYDRDIVDPPSCARRYGALNAAAGRYMNEWKTVDLAVARFPDEQSAEATMFDLLHHARQFGQVGNFAIGSGGSVSYIYSSVRGWFSFTWAQGPWIFSVSGPQFSFVEDLIKHYDVPQGEPVHPSSGA